MKQMANADEEGEKFFDNLWHHVVPLAESTCRRDEDVTAKNSMENLPDMPSDLCSCHVSSAHFSNIIAKCLGILQ